jgi:hypothetical protein
LLVILLFLSHFATIFNHFIISLDIFEILIDHFYNLLNHSCRLQPLVDTGEPKDGAVVTNERGEGANEVIE